MKAVIWYAINPTFRSDPKPLRPGVTHNPVAVIEVAGNDFFEMAQDAFTQMQGENWSPHGEARPLIEALGLKHTSMSVGDFVVIVFAPPTGRDSGRATLMVEPVGFRLVK